MSPLFPRTVRARIGVIALSVLLAMSAQAQAPKNPPRLPPSPAESARIPAGVDAGTPATSDSLPLGTPVPPAEAAGLREQTTRSAAARAAARPAPIAPSSNECLSTADAAFRKAMSDCSAIANRSDRATCAADASRARRDSLDGQPVALPGSGFVGSTATPAARSAATGTTVTTARAGCV